jgi:archaellum component FlaC
MSDHREPVSNALIKLQAEQLQDISLSAQRCEELAKDVEHLNSHVERSARDLDFDHEPLAYTATMRRLAAESE